MRTLLTVLLIVASIAIAPHASALISLLGLKNSMVEFLLEQLSTEGEFEISAEKVTEPEEGVTSIEGLSIADSNGVWLTVSSLDFAWNPSRLLRGEVEFTDLAMTGVRVLRKPVPSAEAGDAAEPETAAQEDDAAPFDWPRSPLTLRIDRLALEDVRLAEPVLGHAISFDAVGAARDEGEIQSARLDLRRTDAIAGTIDFEYTRNFSDNTLAVRLQAAESPDGLVANLADLPRDVPARLDLRADGPPTDWRMTFDLSVTDMVASNGVAAISYEGPIRVDVDLSVRPGPRLSPEIAGLMGDEARLIAQAQEDQNGVIRIARGELISPHVDLVARGTYSRQTGGVDLDLNVRAEGPVADPIEGVAFQELTFLGTLEGMPGKYGARGDIGLTGLETAPADARSAKLTVEIAQSGSQELPVLELDASGLVQGLRLDQVQADVIGSAETKLVATLSGDTVTLETFWLDSEVLDIAASGDADLSTGNAQTGFGVTSPKVGPVAAAYGVDAAGEVQLSGDARRIAGATSVTFETELRALRHPAVDAQRLGLSGTFRQDKDDFAFALMGEGQQMRLDRIGPDILDTARLVLEGSVQDGHLKLSVGRVTSPVLAAEASADLDLDGLLGTVDYRLTTPDLGGVAAAYDVAAQGRLSAQGEAVLKADVPPRLTGTFEGQDLVLDQTRLGTVSIAHDVEISEQPNGTIQAQFADGPLGAGQAGTAFALQAAILRLDQLTADVLGMALGGDLAVDLEKSLAEGALSLSIPDLRSLRSLTGTSLVGRAQGDVRLSAKKGQDASVQLSASGIRLDDTRVGSVRVDGSVQDTLGDAFVDLSLRVRDISTTAGSIPSTQVTAKGAIDRLQIAAQAEGTLSEQAISLQLRAMVNAVGETLRATISRLEVGFAQDRLRQNGPLSLAVKGSTVSARGIDFAIPGDGTFKGDLAYHGGPMSGDLRLLVRDLTDVKELLGLPFRKGSVTASAIFDTRRRRAEVGLSAKEIAFEGVDATGLLNLDAQTSWSSRTANVQASLEGQFGQPMRVSASLPIAVVDGLPMLARRGPVSGSLAWTGRIDDLWALVPAPGHVVTGEAVIDLGVTGDVADPSITGGARIEDGGYQNLDLGTILTDLNLETTLRSDGDLGLSLQASDGANGTLRTNGDIALDASGLDITADLDRAVLVRRDDVTARIDGQISVKGPVTDLVVAGQLSVQEAEVRLVNANPPSIVELEDVQIKGEAPADVTPQESTTTLRIDIDSPGRIFVRGRGLDSEWKMGLKVRGTASAPTVTGQIERVRGRLDLIGKTFQLTRGRIDFDGGRTIDPRIDVVLERQTSDLTGRIVVDGIASAPRLSFTSSPSLPEDEILPRVLFGKSSQALTGSQAIQLALGIATLTDGGGGTLDKVRGAVGLDQLNLEQDEDGSTSVAAGKEVSEGVWVGTKQNLGTNTTSVVVEIDVFDDITIGTEVEQGGGASIGIEWKKDF